MLICFLWKYQQWGKSLPFYQPRTSHEYYLCILAMFTVSRKDVKYVNWPNLGMLNLRVRKSGTRWESAVKPLFPDDIVIKLATSLTMWYIWDLTYLSLYELRTFCHRLRLVNYKKKLSAQGNDQIGDSIQLSCQTWRPENMALQNGWIQKTKM